MTSIPSSRLVLTDLVNQITALHVSTAHPPPTKKAHASPHEDGEPPPPPLIKGLPLPAQDLLIALDYLLPDGIGPALDVLDRGFVTRYQLCPEKPVLEPPTDEKNQDLKSYEAAEAIGDKDSFKPGPGPLPSVSNRFFYQVTSSEPPPKSRGKYTKRFTPKVYTVRVGSWYCSCEAFTVSAFSGPPTSVTLAGGPLPLKRWCGEEEERVWQHLRNGEWVWGGRMLGVESPPICKHLVACVLAEHCGGLFMDHVKEVGLVFEGIVEKSIGLRTYEKVENQTPVRIKQKERLAEDGTGDGTR